MTEEAARLLSGRTRDIRLRGALAQAFQERSFKQTSKIIRSWMAWVVVLDGLAMGTNLLLLPHEASNAMLIPALLIPPVAGTVYIVWLRRRSRLVLYTTLTLGMFGIMLSVSLMGFMAGIEYQERYLDIMLFVAVAAIIIFNVPRWVTHAIAAGGLLLYLAFQLANPLISNAGALSAFVFFASGVTATVVARRTMLILSQRTFLLELRNARNAEELAQANARLEELSRTDPLTGLPNRRHMEEVVERLFESPAAERQRIAMLMCDIDCFKALNDELGHGAGDWSLVEVAKALARSIRAGQDHVARYGGEEFLIVLTDVTFDDAVAAAERIRANVEALSLPNPKSSVMPELTISIGVAVEGCGSGSSSESLQKAADAALYGAKKAGRNRVAADAPIKRLQKSVADAKPQSGNLSSV